MKSFFRERGREGGSEGGRGGREGGLTFVHHVHPIPHHLSTV